VFKEFAQRVQWIVYELARPVIIDGVERETKVPVDPSTLTPVSITNPVNWIRGTVAKEYADYLNAQAGGPTYGIGFVLFDNCGLFCIDIDKALVGGQWSPLSQELCARFTGAYVEVSQRGEGLHIFASYTGKMPQHKKKNVPLHLEFYDELRFIGITGTNAVGSPTFDATALLPALIADYFVPNSDASAPDTWTTEPNATWSGPEDDDELIRRALAARPVAGAVFGSRASFADLWYADESKLARAFPAQSSSKTYDGSSADLALANHLGFWCGGNCDRMLGLMQQSALKRAKWERTDYLHGTIVRAAQQKSYYRQRPEDGRSVDIADAQSGSVGEPIPKPAFALNADGVPLPPSAPAVPDKMPEPPGPLTAFGNVITGDAQAEIFKGCIYVQDINQIMVPEGNTLKREPFDIDARFAAREYIMSRAGDVPSDSAWECFTQSKLIQFPKVRGEFFDPREPEGSIKVIEGQRFVNTWRDLGIYSTPGDASPYFTHVKKLWPNGDDALIYLSFVAACVQYKGYKAAWALFIQGVPGNGKSFLTTVLRYCLGKTYVYTARASKIDKQFNGWLYRKLLVLVEEVKTNEDQAERWEHLKTMITETEQEIEKKGVDQVMREVCQNHIFNSNHKDGLRKTAEDRRICPLYCAQQSVEDLNRDGMDEAYFIKLFDWFNSGGDAIVLHALRTFDIPDKYNFAVGARRAPTTTSTSEAIAAGLGAVEQDIQEAISAGTTGFKGGWINSGALHILLEKIGKAKFIARNRRQDMLNTLGYIRHPGLPDGRVTTPDTAGQRPTLYVRRGHSTEGLVDPNLIKSLYETAQKPS
jgi:hypothetical protein